MLAIFYSNFAQRVAWNHDAFRRYKNFVNPVGDLDVIQEMRTVVKLNEILVLGVLVGKDVLFLKCPSNIYGRKCLPLLLKNWSILYAYNGFQKDNLIYRKGHIQVTFILQKNKNTIWNQKGNMQIT